MPPSPRSLPTAPRRHKRTPRPKPKAPPAGWLRAQAKRLAPHARPLLIGLGTLTLTLGVALGWLLLGFGRSHGPTTGRGVDVDLPADLDPEATAALLSERGLCESRETMAIFLRTTGGTSDFVPGPHFLPEGATPWELRRLLSRAFFRPYAKLTIPEGMNRFDIGARVERLRIASKRAFLVATTDPALLLELGIARPDGPPESAEGYLFPATYEFGVDSDPREVVRRLVSESNKRWDSLASQHQGDLAQLRATTGFGRRELTLLASIVEKEAVVDDERPLIASVFYNRLASADFKPAKRLQSDPTGAYGCVVAPNEAPSCADFGGKPTAAINHDAKNRYNTYAHPGLPPGPISNPGSRSLEAAMAPALTRYFYFVAAGGGRHTFSETFDAHNEAVRRGRP